MCCTLRLFFFVCFFVLSFFDKSHTIIINNNNNTGTNFSREIHRTVSKETHDTRFGRKSRKVRNRNPYQKSAVRKYVTCSIVCLRRIGKIDSRTVLRFKVTNGSVNRWIGRPYQDAASHLRSSPTQIPSKTHFISTSSRRKTRTREMRRWQY